MSLDFLLSPVPLMVVLALPTAVVAGLVRARAAGLLAGAGASYTVYWALANPAPVSAEAAGQSLVTWTFISGPVIAMTLDPDRLSLIFTALVAFGVAVAMFSSAASASGGREHGWEFYPLHLVALSGAVVVLHAGSLALICFGWAVLACSSYLLLFPLRRSAGGQGGPGPVLAIAGIAWIALLGASALLTRFGGGPQAFSDIPAAAFRGEFLVLLLVSLLAMAGQYPFHGLFVNAASTARPAASIIVPSTTVPVAVYLFLRIQLLASGSDFALGQTIMVFGAVTALTGAILSLRSREPQELAGPGMVSLSGFVMMATGVGNPLGFAVLLLVISVFVLTAVSLLAAAGHMKEYRPDPHAEATPVGRWSSLAALGLVASGSGLPFTAGFVLRWGVVVALLESGQPVLAGAGFLAAALSLLALAKSMGGWFSRGAAKAGTSEGSPAVAVALSLLLVASLAAGLFPFSVWHLVVEPSLDVFPGKGILPVSVGVLGLGIGGNIGWGLIAAAAFSVFILVGIGVWYAFGRHGRRSDVFTGGEATVSFPGSSPWRVDLSTRAIGRIAETLYRLLDAQALYGLLATGWHRLAMAWRIAFAVIEDRYYVGAAFLFVALMVLALVR